MRHTPLRGTQLPDASRSDLLLCQIQHGDVVLLPTVVESFHCSWVVRSSCTRSCWRRASWLLFLWYRRRFHAICLSFELHLSGEILRLWVFDRNQFLDDTCEESHARIVVATQSVSNHGLFSKEDVSVELFPEAPWADANLLEFRSSSWATVS